ncbi:MAG: SusD/RagB family nutrient-binding outer membrane lipoprotein [Chitinophagaceae bacterium]|nr:SusD/RagB family nutrient-binding outer membrane lipoprotein [Chitinophagaceae bacterium]
MNIQHILKYLTVIMIPLVILSCTKRFEDTNKPPYLLTEDHVTPELLLTSVEVNAIVEGKDAGHAADYCGMNTQDDNAPFNDLYYNDIWNRTYTAFANNLSAIIRKTQADADLVNKKAIARILKAWVFAQATDTYGDIPYFESNLSPDDAVSAPQYDTQESIYNDLFKELKEAAAELDAGKASYGDADVMYKGDVEKWRKFANSLKLRLALRLRYVDAAAASANISDLQDDDLITSRDDDAYLFTSNQFPEQRNGSYNYLIEQGRLNPSHHIGKTFLDILKNNNDPRLGIYADTALLGGFGYRGAPLLGGNVPVQEKYAYGNGSVSNRSALWFVPEIEMDVLKSSEVYFALAEAALFNIRAGNADEYFKKGIEAGIREAQDFYDNALPQLPDVLKMINPTWGDAEVNNYLEYKSMKQADIDNFLASAATVLSGSDEEKLEQIMNQKLIVLPADGLEGWAEWRRTGYPRVLTTKNDASLLQGVAMRRFHYPQNEELINKTNFTAAIGRMDGEDDVLNKVWWDANPASPHEHPDTVETRTSPW